MKKLLCFLSIAMICSCKTQDNVKPAQNNVSIPSGKSRALSHADGLYDVLGYGIDITLDEHDPNSTSLSPIIDVSRFATDYTSQLSSYLDQDNTGSGGFDFSSGTTALDYSTSLTQTQGISASDGKTANIEGADSPNKAFFTFSFSKNSSDKTVNAYSSKYSYATVNVKRRVKRLAFTGSTTEAILMNYLTPAFLNDVNTLSANDLVARYGTHVLLDISIGGVAKFTYSTIATNQSVTTDRKSDIKAGIGADVSNIAKVNIGYSASSEQITKIQNTSQNTIANMTYYGGTNSGVTISIDKDGNTSQSIDFAGWESSVTTTNATLVDIGHAVYLSDFITNPIKKAAVQTAIQNKIAAAQITLATDPITVFYNSSSGGDHFTTGDPNATNGFSGWQNYGIDFRAFLGQAPGTVPVYIFYNSKGFDHFTTGDPNATNGIPNWANYGISFYAYKTQVPGTIPIYLYYNYAGGDHFTTSNPSIASQYTGWANYGVVFYAFPK